VIILYALQHRGSSVWIGRHRCGAKRHAPARREVGGDWYGAEAGPRAVDRHQDA
jgi:hypothetical protein